MSADLVIAGYVRIAKQDLDGACVLNRDGNRNAAYLCEQAAEKLIRAVLTSEGIQAGVRHELPDMVAKIQMRTRSSSCSVRLSTLMSTRPPTDIRHPVDA